ncbi:pantoate--beta-alanine ligase [Veillonella criceti]|uniref:Pantothenate synthetase n=1 Tax=Veillonella criceti TaxID=103891 RepID=A0A380NNJ9_9FIRM|nr:pantoate--beta-alanine ligase [Veillonella criceti]SUP44800.1 Pantothenate synthetase [Veillonella criceti]
MKIITTIAEVRAIVKEWRRAGETVGFVPTMGYLHEGHASLISRAVADNDHVVVSTFVNPTQFGPTEDLEAYPRDEARDAALCEGMGADIMFRPDPAEMYNNPKVSVVVNDMNEHLCGLSRPIHFHGVCTVVTKLFNIVTPDTAYFGEKDAQQLAIIRKMVQDLNMPLEIVGCPIVREADGLAKSSRNTYLSSTEREAALCLSRSIFYGQEQIKAGMRANDLEQAMKEIIAKEPLARIEYVKVVDALTMNDIEIIDRPVLIAVAVYIGKTRLIDNFSFDPKINTTPSKNK